MKRFCIYLSGFTILLVLSISLTAQNLYTEHLVFNDFGNAVSIAAADFDGDGDMDMVASSFDGNYVAWMENDGNQNFTQHMIIEDFHNALALDVAHIDNDDDFDIVCVAKADNMILWFDNDGFGNFSIDTVVTNWQNAYFVMARDHFKDLDLDIDGDGDTDFLAATNSPGRVSWFENDGNQNFIEHIIKEDWYWAWYSTATDLDQDNDVDIIATAKAGQILWFVNDGNQNFTEDTIIASWGQPSSVLAGDIDGDGDLDLAGTSVTAQEVAWFENIDYEFTKHTIKSGYNGAFSVIISDFNDDGILDVAAEAWIGSEASVFYNDGNQNFTEEVFCTTAYELIKIFATDLDLDGDQDILGATAYTNDVRWWENLLNTTSIDEKRNNNSINSSVINVFPNPSASEVRITYFNPSIANVRLSISDMSGKSIVTLFEGIQEKGNYSFLWKGKTESGHKVNSGIYIIRLKVKDRIYSRQVVKN
jgi:hypothetical protein